MVVDTTNLGPNFVPINGAKPVAPKDVTTETKPQVHSQDRFTGSSYSDFKDDYFSREFVVYDPTTGQAVFYETEEEMQAHQNEILERRKADLMLSSSGDAVALAQINKSIREQKLQAGCKEDYASLEADKAAVIDAAKAQAGSLTVAEVKLLAQEYPELNSLVEERISQMRARGIEPQVMANMQIGDIDDLAKQKIKPQAMA